MDGNVVSWLARGTSPVDWCESNYTVTPHIAEFFNTISNILFLIVPAAITQLWYSYAHHVSRGIHIVHGFFIVIGLSSAYFHATLSLLGQLLDELSILWVLMVSYSIFTPHSYRPKPLRRHPIIFRNIVALLGIFITLLAFWKPEINQYALFLTGAPAVYILVREVQWCRDYKVSILGISNIFTLCVAATAWISDRFLCDRLSDLKIYFLHGLWHIFIFAASYTTQVLICFFHASQDVPESRPELRFWPRKGPYIIPYIHCNSRKHEKCP